MSGALGAGASGSHDHTPGRGLGFLNIFFTGTSTGKHAGVCLGPAWASHPQLGLVVRRGARAQIHFRGLCHCAGELAACQAAEPPSRRAAESTSRRVRERQEIEPASFTPTLRTVVNAPSEITCPYAAVFRLSPPLVAHSCTRLAIRSGQSHPVSIGIGQSPPSRDPATRPPRKSMRRP